MKTLQSNFTTPEQSKRLLELGVPADSADCYMLVYAPEYEGIPRPFFLFPKTYEYIKDFNARYGDKTMPCWSVGRLIEIIKICSDVPIDWTGGLNEERDILEVIDSTLYALCLGKHMDFSKLEE